MRRIVAVILLLCVLYPLSGCSSRSSYTRKSFFAMDTTVEIKIDPNFEYAKTVFDNCEKILKRLEQALSRTIHGNDVWKINEYTEVAELSNDTVAVIEVALSVSELCSGFDITTASLTDLWQKCANRGTLPTNDEIIIARSAVGYDKLKISGNTLKKESEAVKIDLGGIAKGYAADVLVDYLKSAGVQYGIVSFGSCVAVFGELDNGVAFKIGIKDPSDTSKLIGYVYMTEGVLSVTGDYERFVEISGEKYHHVLSPSNGYPVNNGTHSVVVICDNGAIADALSTGLFVRGECEDLYENGDIDFECIFIGDYGIKMTDGMTNSFELIK